MIYCWTLVATTLYLLRHSVVIVVAANVDITVNTNESLSAQDYLASANALLQSGDYMHSIAQYRLGLAALTAAKRSTDEDTTSLDSTTTAPLIITKLSLFTNLATALLAVEGMNAQAVEAYQQALVAFQNHATATETATETATTPSSSSSTTHHDEAALIAAQAAFYLGMTHQDAAGNNARDPRVLEAIEAYSLAIHLDPLHWSAMANLGSIYHDVLSDYDRALAAYNQAYATLTGDVTTDMEPTDPPPEPRYILSQLQYRIGLCLSQDLMRSCQVADDPTPMSCQELASHAFSLAVEYDPTNEAAKHMLATLTIDATMKRASNKYVTDLFDEYAANFEHSLVQELGYNGYQRLRRAFDATFLPQSTPMFGNVVDAGCGTGLVGEQFRNISRHLTGIDLSSVILDQAELKRPGLYNRTIAGDATEVFRSKPSSIDLIVAADSFIYFGDLDPLFDSMQQGLKPSGYAAFTLEDVDLETETTLVKSKPDWRWQLTASGRFAHHADYVSSMASAHDFTVMYYERMDGFRRERGLQVRGHIFILRKQEETELDQEL